MTWITVAEFARKTGKKSPQVIYNKIATGKLVKDVQWREVEVLCKRKEVWYAE